MVFSNHHRIVFVGTTGYLIQRPCRHYPDCFFSLESLQFGRYLTELPSLVHQSPVLLTLFLFPRSTAEAVTTTLQGHLQFPDKTPFNITTRISLNNAEYTTYSRSDGSFVIYNVPPGIHQLDIHSPTYHFGQVRVQLLKESMNAPMCLEYTHAGAVKIAIKYPLVLTPHATYDYFEPQKGFSIFSLLKNPMVLMMLVSAGLMVGMPKLMENLDPEEKEQMRKQMQAQSNPTEMLSQMFSMGGSGDDAGADSAKARRERRRAKKD